MAWSPQIACGARLAPIAAVAAVLAAGRLRPLIALAAVVVWIPAAVVLAGLPVTALAPGHVPELVRDVGSGAAQLTMPGPLAAPARSALVAVMWASGALWIGAGALAVAAPAWSRRQLAALCLAAAPWLAAVSQGTGDRDAWLGGVALLAGLLWLSCSRVTLAMGVVVALLSVVVAQAAGPRTRWFDHGSRSGMSAFDTLNTAPNYGPSQDRRTGARMLEIAARAPALWRMQTLDEFDGTGWAVSPTPFPELAQPAARMETVNVRVLGLRNDLVVAPGRIEAVDAQGPARPAAGDAWRVPGGLASGSTYRLIADYVHPTAAQLAGDRAPIGARAREYTRVGPTSRGEKQLEQLGRELLATLGIDLPALPSAAIPDPRVVALARRLSAGAGSEWELVARVERFLLGGRRFRYTTHVPPAGAQPLAQFLLRTHAGDCQHFAGAAALLLRLAGVPTRVVSGFATGTRTAPGRYTVRDLDAHAWIEVYFPGYGWVSFNPTPSGARVEIAAGIDRLRPSALVVGSGRRGPASEALALLAAVAALAVGVARKRRRAQRTGDRMQELLERTARRAGARLEPSTTLAGLATALARLGPRTAALVAETERVRFAAGASASAGHAPLRLARALVGDLGPAGALLAYLPVVRRMPGRSVAPATEERYDEQRQQ